MITINIEKEKINWKPVQTKSGLKHYATLAIDNLKEVDDKGHTHSVWNSQSQLERAEKAKKEYCGRGKEYKVDAKKEYNNINKQEEERPEDLPF